VPLLGFRSLELQRARALVPATAVAEAGRGRLYWLTPEGDEGVGDPADVPARWPLVGWLKAARPDLVDDAHLRSFGAAAAMLAGDAKQVPYHAVRPVYSPVSGSLAQ
jgi:hypothetical protein